MSVEHAAGLLFSLGFGTMRVVVPVRGGFQEPGGVPRRSACEVLDA